jgi:hypothetical protein
MTRGLKRKSYWCTKKQQELKFPITESFYVTNKLAINDLLWLDYMYIDKMPIAGIIATSKIHSEATTAWKIT